MLTLDIGIVTLIVFATWHYALRCGYISDDHATVEQRKDIIPDSERNPSKEEYIVKIFNDGVVMYYLTRFLLKLGIRRVPFFWHLMSLALHLANCYLLILVLIPILGYQNALIAVAFWAVNPMLNQNVVWISGRPYLIGVFLALMAIVCGSNPFAFIAFYILAVITNISIVFVPVIFYFIHPDMWQAKIYLMSMFALAFPFVIWKFKKRFTNALVIDRENFRVKPRKLNTLVRIISYYLWTFFVPVRMGWYHQAGFRYNKAWEKFNIWALASYLIVGFLIFKCGVPACWILLGILPNSNLYATNAFLQDRYIYFSSIGVGILLAPIFAQFPILFYCAMTFYMTRAYMYSRHMINDEAVYRENWRNHPNSDHAINNLSYFLIQKKRYDESRVVIMHGLSINQMNKMLWYNLGITWAAQGNFNSDEGKFRFLRAVDCWKMCLQIEPRWEKPAEDLKKLIKILVDNKVLTISMNDSAGGVSISVPALSGIIEGSTPDGNKK